MRWTRALAAGLLVAGCSSSGALLTGDPLGNGACYTSAARGVLEADAQAGVAIVDEDSGSSRHPVMWPKGYTARRDGNNVTVMDGDGHVVATTGHRYRIGGGYSGDSFATCGDVSELP